MGDLILQTEPAEFQYSKQTTKMAFLHQEIRQLQEYINDLENVVKLNKDAMRIAISPANSNVTQTKPKHGGHNDTLSTSASANEGSIMNDKANIISMQQIIDHLHQENISLLNTAQRLRKEREMAESRALISEQICEEAQRHENEVLTEMEEKIYELRKLVQDKEYTIQELERIKPIPDGAEVAIKYREVISPSEQSLKLLEEIDTLNKMISKLSKELNKAQVEKEDLIHKNMNLTTELRKLEAALASPLAGRLSVKKLASNQLNSSFEGGKPIFEGNDPDQSEIMDYLPEKVQHKGQKNKNTLVPTLNLAPAKKIQDSLNEKQQPHQKPAPNYMNPLMHEKMLTLEKEIDRLKKLLSREMINNNLLSDEIAKLHRQNSTLIAQNETLIKSNKRYEEKAQKMHYTLEFYKEFYEKYMDMVTKRHNPTKSLSSQADFAKLMNFKKPSETLSSVLNAPPILKNSKPLTAVAEEGEAQVNISILEEGGEVPKPTDDFRAIQKIHTGSPGLFDHEDDEEQKEKREITKEDCKIYLINLAKDLYLNSNITKSAFTKQILMNMDTRGINAPATQVVKLKRSLSNPLDYISNSKQLNKANLGSRKPIQKKAKKPKKSNGDLSPISNNVLDLNISVIGKPAGGPQGNHVANKKSIMDDKEISFMAYEDGKFVKNQEISFISNDGLF